MTETSTATPTAMTPDFRDNGANGATDYSYDVNGNLTGDKNKSLNQAIVYSTANKPLRIIVDGKGTIEYTYDAAGTLLRRKIIPISGTAETQDYIGSAVFKDNKLQHVLHEEGRCRPTAPDYITLAHELGHAWSYVKGFQNRETWFTNKGNPVVKDEWYAGLIENIIRGEAGLPLRTHYDNIADKSPVPYEPSRLINTPEHYFGQGVLPENAVEIKSYWTPSEKP